MHKRLEQWTRNWEKTTRWLVIIFILSRLFIWVFKPTTFTEITYSYMPYAQLWASGTTPYLEQWYEYPPATIPLFYLPHVIDMATLNQPWHINYGHAYRGQLLLLDIALFTLIWHVLRKLKVNKKVFLIAIGYYIFATAKAHHFIYDTMDITFAAALSLSVAAPILFTGWKGQLGMWLGYGLGVGLKLLNGPLGLIYAVADQRKWFTSGLMGAIAFALIWGIPLFLYRSSLQVMLVYHQLRGLQIDSAGAVIVRTLNGFTNSEKVIEVYKNYEIAGPMTDVALKIISPLFIITLIAFILYGTWIVFRANSKDLNYWRLTLTLGYVLMLMLTMKVLSLPFMLWQIPLLAMYPFEDYQKQLKFVIPSALIITLTLSPIPYIDLGLFTTQLLVGIARTILFGYLFYQWWLEHRRHLQVQ